MAEKPRRIVGLRWEETSGVDHPANEEEGWFVMKSADGPDDPEADNEPTDTELDELIASDSASDDEAGAASKKGIGATIGRLVERLLSRNARKYLEADIAAAIKANASGFVTELVAIINEKGLSTSEVSKRVTEAVESLQAAVETELNKEGE